MTTSKVRDQVNLSPMHHPCTGNFKGISYFFPNSTFTHHPLSSFPSANTQVPSDLPPCHTTL